MGCVTPQYEVVEPDSRFSENKNLVYVAKNNRISTKSIAGGIYVDTKGVYINPVVELDKTTKNVVAVAMRINNQTEFDTMSGGPNELGRIQEVVFLLPDGKLISPSVSHVERKHADLATYNSVGRYASRDILETAMLSLSKAQFAALATAETYACKITGSKQSVVYEDEDILPAFRGNLKLFYTDYVKGK